MEQNEFGCNGSKITMITDTIHTLMMLATEKRGLGFIPRLCYCEDRMVARIKLIPWRSRSEVGLDET